MMYNQMKSRFAHILEIIYCFVLTAGSAAGELNYVSEILCKIDQMRAKLAKMCDFDVFFV